MKLIVGVPWTVMAASSRQFFPPECRDIVRGRVAQASSSDRKNPKNRRKWSRRVSDRLSFAQLGCWILVVVGQGLIFLKISWYLGIDDSWMAG